MLGGNMFPTAIIVPKDVTASEVDLIELQMAYLKMYAKNNDGRGGKA
jgi:hypothetical protein